MSTSASYRDPASKIEFLETWIVVNYDCPNQVNGADCDNPHYCEYCRLKDNPDRQVMKDWM